MFNELSEASDSAKALRALSLPDAPEANVQYLYNQNEDFLAQMIEIFNQSGMDGSREKFKNFWFLVNRMDLAPPRFIDRVLYPTLAKFDEYTYTRDVDLQMMIAELQRQASNGKKKTVLVAHSQGNFYANQIKNNLQTSDPGLAACLAVVGVASPATYVAGGGPYTTASNDKVIGFARGLLPWGNSILPHSGISSGFRLNDPFAHEFVDSYVDPFRTRIRNHVVDAANVIKLNPKCSDCGAPINSAGSTGTHEFVKTIGTGRQTVTVNFEAYSIPDKLEIFAGGKVLAATNGFVQGLHQLVFTFDSAALGTTQITARVTGNSDTNTQWKLCLDCSGSTCGWVSEVRSVNIRYHDASDPFHQWSCASGDVSVDSKFLGRIAAESSVVVKLTAGGDHQLASARSGCVCTQTLGCSVAPPSPKFTVTYVDGSGVSHYHTTQVAPTTALKFPVR